MTESLLQQGKEAPWNLEEESGAALTKTAPQATRYDPVSSTIAYVGKAKPGVQTSVTTWQIKRLTFTSAGAVTVEFADGDVFFDNVWDNRASLSYS